MWLREQDEGVQKGKGSIQKGLTLELAIKLYFEDKFPSANINFWKDWAKSRGFEHRDIGVDLVIEINGDLWAVQTKNWKNKVNLSDIGTFLACLSDKDFNFKRGILVTTSGLTNKARERLLNINLQNRDIIVLEIVCCLSDFTVDNIDIPAKNIWKIKCLDFHKYLEKAKELLKIQGPKEDIFGPLSNTYDETTFYIQLLHLKRIFNELRIMIEHEKKEKVEIGLVLQKLEQKFDHFRHLDDRTVKVVLCDDMLYYISARKYHYNFTKANVFFYLTQKNLTNIDLEVIISAWNKKRKDLESLRKMRIDKKMEIARLWYGLLEDFSSRFMRIPERVREKIQNLSQIGREDFE
jgi:hypothetical protein